jgi:DNA-binding NarL/FixJ family response regulator
MPSTPIRVLIVDDHAMVRRGLSVFIKSKPDLLLVGEAGGGREAITLCDQLRPDVVLMDLVMPELDGVATTRAIRERWPTTHVIALTSFQEHDLVQGVLKAGAIGYLLKNISAEELAEAIRAAHTGRSTLAPEAVQALVESAHGVESRTRCWRCSSKASTTRRSLTGWWSAGRRRRRTSATFFRSWKSPIALRRLRLRCRRRSYSFLLGGTLSHLVV